MKNLLLISFLLFSASLTFSQSLTKKDVRNGMNGKWTLVYENENLLDSNCLVSKRIYQIKKNKGEEIGIWKNGDTTKIPIKVKFIGINDNGEFEILFQGGIWVDNQNFLVKAITNEKITMLSCDKYDCENAYFIKEE